MSFCTSVNVEVFRLPSALHESVFPSLLTANGFYDACVEKWVDEVHGTLP